MESLKVQVGNKWFTVEISDINSEWVTTKVDGDIIKINLTELKEPDPALQEQPKNKPPTTSKPADIKPEQNTKTDTTSDETIELKSPMPGTIISVNIKVGDRIQPGDDIYILEAMKMQQTIRCEEAGIINSIEIESGQQVLDGDTIMTFKQT